MPISWREHFLAGLIILGLGVGIIGGFFGLGGAWMVTPGLNILGFPMAFAIGTDVAQMAGKSLISTMRHGKFGNVDYALGLTMLVGTVIGVEIGAQMVMWLERIGEVDKVVRWLYVVLLVLLAWLVFHDVALRRRKEREAKAHKQELDKTAVGLDWATKLQAFKIPPMVHFKRAGITCSAWLPIIVSLFTGWLAGILGIGGGLIRMPALVYLVGCPTASSPWARTFLKWPFPVCTARPRMPTRGASSCSRRSSCSAARPSVRKSRGGHQVCQGLRHPHRVRSGRARLPDVRGAQAPQAEFPAWAWLFSPLATVEVLGFVSAISIYITIRMVQGAKAELAAKKQQAVGN